MRINIHRYAARTGALHAFSAAYACAAEYPAKPIRVIVGFGAGGPVDITARTIGSKLSEAFAQPVVVDNRVGASGLLASGLVAKAAPDGYTLLLCTASNAITAAVSAGPGRNFLHEFAPISKVALITSILVVNPALPVQSVRELVALAKSKPGQLTKVVKSAGIKLE